MLAIITIGIIITIIGMAIIAIIRIFSKRRLNKKKTIELHIQIQEANSNRIIQEAENKRQNELIQEQERTIGILSAHEKEREQKINDLLSGNEAKIKEIEELKYKISEFNSVINQQTEEIKNLKDEKATLVFSKFINSNNLIPECSLTIDNA